MCHKHHCDWEMGDEGAGSLKPEGRSVCIMLLCLPRCSPEDISSNKISCNIFLCSFVIFEIKLLGDAWLLLFQKWNALMTLNRWQHFLISARCTPEGFTEGNWSKQSGRQICSSSCEGWMGEQTKHELCYKVRTLIKIIDGYRFIDCNRCTTLVQDVSKRIIPHHYTGRQVNSTETHTAVEWSLKYDTYRDQALTGQLMADYALSQAGVFTQERLGAFLTRLTHQHFIQWNKCSNI